MVDGDETNINCPDTWDMRWYYIAIGIIVFATIYGSMKVGLKWGKRTECEGEGWLCPSWRVFQKIIFLLSMTIGMTGIIQMTNTVEWIRIGAWRDDACTTSDDQ